MDWSDCPLVERDPFKLGGIPILKGTRMQADSIVENYESGSPVDEIADNFEISEDTIRLVLKYTHAKQKPPFPREGSLRQQHSSQAAKVAERSRGSHSQREELGHAA